MKNNKSFAWAAIAALLLTSLLGGCSTASAASVNQENSDTAESLSTDTSAQSNAEFSYDIHTIEDKGTDWSDITPISAIEIKVSDSSGKEIQDIVYNYDLSGFPSDFNAAVQLSDVNFDGRDDLLLDLGHYGNQGVHYYACYLWDASSGQYKEVPAFQDIESPALDTDGQRILSHWRDSAATYGYAVYVWTDESPVMDRSLSEQYDENQVASYTESRLSNGQMIETLSSVSITALDQAYWNIGSDVWNSDIPASTLLYSTDSAK